MIKDFLIGVIPPKVGDLDGHNKWQWAVFMKLWLLIVFVLWSLGVFSYIGFSGLARAEDVQQLQANVSAIQESLLEAQLLNTRREQCRAVEAKNAAAISFYAEKLIDLRKRYYALTQHNWDIPDCETI